MPFILVNLRIPALDFSQSVASGVQIIEAIARQAYLICRKAIESLQPTLTSERRAIFESESHWPNLRASFKFPWSKEPVPASIIWLSWLRNVLCILGMLLWIIAALMDW
jgi:hypothetical protein